MIYFFATIFSILFFSYLTVLSIFIFRHLNENAVIKKREILYKRFAETFSILEEAKLIAFEFVLQQDIYAYHASNMKIGKDEMPDLQKKFIKMVFDLCGHSVTKDLKEFKGDLKPIGLELSTYFINRINKEESSLFSKDDMESQGTAIENSILSSTPVNKQNVNFIGK